MKFSNIEITKQLSERNENEKVVINVQVPLTIEVPKNLSVINDLQDKNGRFSQKIQQDLQTTLRNSLSEVQENKNKSYRNTEAVLLSQKSMSLQSL